MASQIKSTEVSTMVRVPFLIDRKNVEGLDGKSDKDVCLEWFRVAFSSSVGQNDPFVQLLWRRLLSKIELTEASEVELTEDEYLMIKLTLIRANFTAAGNNVYSQMLEKFGVYLK